MCRSPSLSSLLLSDGDFSGRADAENLWLCETSRLWPLFLVSATPATVLVLVVAFFLSDTGGGAVLDLRDDIFEPQLTEVMPCQFNEKYTFFVLRLRRVSEEGLLIAKPNQLRSTG